MRTPDEIKNIINAIPSFKYEEMKTTADTAKLVNNESTSESTKLNNRDKCAICLDFLVSG